ncbi:ABC transporter ATP-binding protein [Salinibacterium sp. PAMC 21357]|uniref:ABC transporter ATP-binding protein n=1 Tax=Salinibacterium sp. PAMC 21357 TaxID=1112215 RepID=UPI000287F9A5|nr:ABC transporter ATP-binding protein [Salinibacterium sp. PAMC 21357]
MKRIWATLKELLPLLPAGARRFYTWYMVTTSSLTILDVAAMALLAIVIAPAVNGTDIDIPVIGVLPPSATPLLVLIACLLIISKSVFAVALHWVATKQFAKYELEIGRRLFRAYIHSSWEERSKRSVAEITRIADAGIAGTIAGFILPLAVVPSALTTFTLVLAVLVFTDPMTSVIALVYLSLVTLLVNKVVTRRSLEAGQVNRDYSYRVAILMTEMVDALKELSLRNRLDQVADVVTESRIHSVRARRNGSFLGILPLYAFEAALVGGFLLIGFAAYLTSGLNGAVSSVALFAATGFRLIPAINSVLASVVQATASIPTASDVIKDLTGAEKNVSATTTAVDVAVLPANPQMLRLDSVSFTYPRSSERVLRELSLDIPLGSSLGIVGPSGAGKSTLVDLLLGLSVPTGGLIDIDGEPLTDVIRAWRERVGYVPQRVALFDGSIAQNVALTWDDNFDRDRVRDALEKARLTTLVASRDKGIDERIGERGVSLSGGQQQRLGIARALYADPLVLVLDEATSSLDTKTEDEITQAIRSLHGEVTLISVAHRLSTIKDYDQVAYLEGGRIVGKGTFSELALKLPEFGEQVALAGLAEEAGLHTVVTRDSEVAQEETPR